MLVFQEQYIVVKFDQKDQNDIQKFNTFNNMDNVAKAIKEFHDFLSIEEKNTQERIDKEPRGKSQPYPLNYSSVIRKRYIETMEKYGVKPQV